MTQTSITESERAAALRRFGYTEPEAEFLNRAALNGGYFLRRQYGQFLGREDGGTVSQLVQKAIDKGHVRTSTWRQRTQLYHLCARPFYNALGQDDNRNRRTRQLATIKNKIMGLDFVLAHPRHHYLATEQDKLDYFTGTLNLDAAVLPVKVYSAINSHATTARYFIEKFPIFVAQNDSDSPVASFCFVDEGMASLSAFETFLGQYRRLLSSLPMFQLIYVAASTTHFAAAQRRFESLIAHGNHGSRTAAEPRKTERLLEYFQARHLYESQQFASFDRVKLLWLRDAREEFSGRETEALFEHWKAAGADAVRQILTPKQPVRPSFRGTFSTCLLGYDYGLFECVTAA